MIAEIPPPKQQRSHELAVNLSKEPVGSLTLEQFVTFLPLVLSQMKTGVLPNVTVCGYVADLFQRLTLQKREWEKYAFFDPNKNYTRNLIATDGETFTLILMCWTPGRESPVHDHPCDGCWVRVFEGSVQEARYIEDGSTGKMICTTETLFNEGEVSYMHDSMGYHKIGNPSCTIPAVSLHLYCPPFDKCKIWLDPSVSSKASNANICFYSMYGEKV